MYYIIENGCDRGKNGYIGVLDNINEAFESQEEAIKEAGKYFLKNGGIVAVRDYFTDELVWTAIEEI